MNRASKVVISMMLGGAIGYVLATNGMPASTPQYWLVMGGVLALMIVTAAWEEFNEQLRMSNRKWRIENGVWIAHQISWDHRQTRQEKGPGQIGRDHVGVVSKWNEQGTIGRMGSGAKTVHRGWIYTSSHEEMKCLNMNFSSHIVDSQYWPLRSCWAIMCSEMTKIQKDYLKESQFAYFGRSSSWVKTVEKKPWIY